MVQRIADLLCRWRAAGQARELRLQPGEQVLDQRLALGLTRCAPGIRRLAAHLRLDGVERGDPPQRLPGDRPRPTLRQVDELPSDVSPTICERRPGSRGGDALVDRVAVALQDPGVAAEQPLRMLPAAAPGA